MTKKEWAGTITALTALFFVVWGGANLGAALATTTFIGGAMALGLIWKQI